MVYALQDGVIYGPVNSRRYGLSLGINLMPSRFKLCSFNCVYCHYGLTHKCRPDASEHRSDLPSVAAVAEALRQALTACGELELITFSGNGEPTLHPDFPELVEVVRKLRDELKPQAQVALLSNSTGLFVPNVRESIARIDLPVMKLDAGTEATFQAINRPAQGIRFAEIVHWLTELDGITIQTVLLDGHPTNTGKQELVSYFELLTRIRPREVHLYSIDRPVPDANILLVNPERLASIAREGQNRTGLSFRFFHVG